MTELLEGTLFEFGPFRLDTQRRLLCRRDGGEKIHLSPKAVDVLICLVGNAGEVVTKNQLLDEVWENVFVEEANLSQTIFVLRKALGDDPKNPQFVLTVPNRGYRLIVPISPVSEIVGTPRVTVSTADPDGQHDEITLDRRTMIFVASFGFLVLLSIVLVLFLSGSNAPTDPNRPTAVAVLPFRNLGPPEDDVIAAGVSESMTTRLANIRSVVVRPSGAVQKYAGTTADPRQIGEDLSADILVMGSVQRVEGNLRVYAQLIRVKSGASVWGRIYDDQARALFGIQDRLSLDLADALSASLTPEERSRVAKNYTSNPDAQLRYFQGVYLWNKRSPQDLKDAIVEFTKATELEPGYALAYIGLANCYAVLSNYGVEMPSVANPKAREAIDMALRIDDGIAEAYAARGTIQAYYDWDWKAADESFRRAVELKPNYATGQQWYAEYLFEMKRYDEAFRHYEAAIALDPRSPTVRTSYASRFLYLGQYQKVIDLMNEVHAIDPNYGYSYFHQGLALEKSGRDREAFESFVKVMEMQGEPKECADEVRAAFDRGGLSEYWRVRLNQLLTRPHLRNFPPNGVASVFARVGDTENTVKYLQKGMAEHDPWMVGLSHPLFFDLVKDDPRFIEIVRQLNFPQNQN